MIQSKWMGGLLLIAVVLTSCTQATEKVKEETGKIVSQTNEKVKKVIDELGLVYLE